MPGDPCAGGATTSGGKSCNGFPTSSNGMATGAFPMRTDSRESQTRDRAGWWRDTPDGRLYLFTTEGMNDALKGFDFQAGA
jgi:hypothetical protein